MIVVNFINAKMGGSLTLLKQFIRYVSNSEINKGYLFFISNSVYQLFRDYESKNLKIVGIDQDNKFSRILWDKYGFKQDLKMRNISVECILNFGNTPLSYDKSIPQILYFHQAIGLSNSTFRVVASKGLKYFLYRYFYNFFVKWNLNNIDAVIVQAEWVKEKFSAKYKYPINNICVIQPDISYLYQYIGEKAVYNDKYTLFYPAGGIAYKNHQTILKAIKLMLDIYPDFYSKFKCIFTISKDEIPAISSFVDHNNLGNIVSFVGQIPFKDVVKHYIQSDCLIFPSLDETFGLPFKEAEFFDLEILVVDLPYARNTLKDCSNVTFIDKDNVDAWVKNIAASITNRRSRVIGKNNTLNKSTWAQLENYFLQFIKYEE